MSYYIAWLNGTSVARGTEEDVRDKAVRIFNSARWQETVTARGKATELRITKGMRQTLVTSEPLSVLACPECGSVMVHAEGCHVAIADAMTIMPCGCTGLAGWRC